MDQDIIFRTRPLGKKEIIFCENWSVLRKNLMINDFSRIWSWCLHILWWLWSSANDCNGLDTFNPCLVAWFGDFKANHQFVIRIVIGWSDSLSGYKVRSAFESISTKKNYISCREALKSTYRLYLKRALMGENFFYYYDWLMGPVRIYHFSWS